MKQVLDKYPHLRDVPPERFKREYRKAVQNEKAKAFVEQQRIRRKRPCR